MGRCGDLVCAGCGSWHSELLSQKQRLPSPCRHRLRPEHWRGWHGVQSAVLQASRRGACASPCAVTLPAQQSCNCPPSRSSGGSLCGDTSVWRPGCGGNPATLYASVSSTRRCLCGAWRCWALRELCVAFVWGVQCCCVVWCVECGPLRPFVQSAQCPPLPPCSGQRLLCPLVLYHQAVDEGAPHQRRLHWHVQLPLLGAAGGCARMLALLLVRGYGIGIGCVHW